MIYWLTGQPGAGKTTIAKELCRVGGMVTPSPWFNVDGDDIRNIFDNKDYSEQGRRKNIELAQQLSQYLHSKGKNVVVSLVSPYKDQRDTFKKKMGDDLVEVYVHTSEVRGRENFFVENYEPPTENFLDICTDNVKVEICVYTIMAHSF
jgi:adenylylsulfate kinase-like enzyme